MSEKSRNFLAVKNLRKQTADEIIIDIDDRTEHGLKCVSAVGILLYNEGYWFSLWYAEGMKQAHIHIPKVFNLDGMSREQVVKYKKAFIKKYIPKEFHQPLIEKGVRGEIPDFSLCEPYEELYHPIPQEIKPHHKYKTLYIKIAEFNPGKLYYNFTEPELYNEAVGFDEPEQTKTSKKQNENTSQKKIDGNFLFQKIASKIKITAIADSFGLSPKGKTMRECPFHADSNASLSLNDEKGIFNCFSSGCNAKGNIIKFYAMLKEINPKFRFDIGLSQ